MSASPSQNGLSARGLTYRRDGRDVLSHVSVDVVPGTFSALLGANGSGKTTLLRLLLGLIEPQSGTIALDGVPIANLDRRTLASRIAYVPQAHIAAFPFTALEVVMMGRTPAIGWRAKPGMAERDAALGALEHMGMSAFAERSYSALSGGERQSVLIARALAQGAQTLLLDEPTAALDPGQQIRVLNLLQRLAEDGHAILMSLHQPELALRWCDAAILLRSGEVAACGPSGAVITADRMTQLYGTPVSIVAAGDQRFIIAGTEGSRRQ